MDDKKKSEYIEKESRKKIFFSGKNYIDRIYSLIEDNKYLSYLTFVFLIIILMLLIGYKNLENKIEIKVEIPPKLYHNGTIYIGYEKANSLFYKIWGEYVVNEISNYSPVNIDEKVKKTILLFSPDKIIKAEADFLQFAKNVKQNLITHSFKEYKATANNKGEVKVEGLGIKTLGANLSTQYQICEFDLKFKIVDYHLYLTGYKERCTPVNKKKYEEQKKEYLKELKKKNKGKK